MRGAKRWAAIMMMILITASYTPLYAFGLENEQENAEVTEQTELANDNLTETVDINDTTITLDQYEFIYDPQIIPEPAVSVEYEGNALVEDEDYELLFDQSNTIGTHIVKVTGIGQYSGEAEITYEIVEEEITPGDVPASGSGTEEDPYIIMNREDLMRINEDLSASYKLGADIDLAGENFEAIGSSTNPFTGSLDGAGHKLTSFTYTTSNKNTTSVKAALFAATSGASINDLVLRDINVDVTVLMINNTADVGVLSLDDTASEFSNIEVNGNIKASAYTLTVAGLVCNADRTIVDNVNNNINMTVSSEGREDKVGGILSTSKGCKITNCSMKGTMKREKGYIHAGGIVCCHNGLTEIVKCVNNADITAYNCGGIIASCSKSCGSLSIIQCTNKGRLISVVNKKSAGSAAGIVCVFAGSSDSMITDCINEGTIDGGSCTAYGIGNAETISGCENRASVSGANACGIGDGRIISNCANWGDIKGSIICGIGSGSISNCTNHATITGDYEAFGIGTGSTFTDCINYGDVTQTAEEIPRPGGIASGICSSIRTKAIRCCNHGRIKGKRACGIAETNKGELSECFNSGYIVGTADSSGLVIRNRNLISDSYNNGCVTGENAAGIVINNDDYAVVVDCYNVGAIDGKTVSAGIAATNSNNVLDSYYYNGTSAGVGSNMSGAVNTTVSLTGSQLYEESSYAAFEFIEDDDDLIETGLLAPFIAYAADDNSGKWVMSNVTGMPRLANMPAEDEVYVKSISIKKYPKTKVVNTAIKKSDIQLQIVYSNNKKATVKKGFLLSSYKKTIGKRTITVNYLNKKATFKCSFVPAKVSKVTLTPGRKKVTIKIKKAAGAKKYEIYRSTKKSSGYKRIKTTTSLKYTNKGLKSKKVYYYKVRAINGNYKGAYSSVYRTKTK